MYQSGSFIETEPIYLQDGIYYKLLLMQLWKLSPMICHLQAGDPGKLVWCASECGVVLKSKSQRANGTDSSLSLKAENQEYQEQKINMPAQLGKVNFTFLHLFFQLGTSMDQMLPTYTLGRTMSFTQSAYSNVNIFQKYPHRHTEIIFNQQSGHPMAQSS